MPIQDVDSKTKTETETDIIRVELGDWLYNAGIIGLMRILSFNEDNEIAEYIEVGDTFIEFKRSDLEGLTKNFFEVGFEMHGKFESIKKWLKELDKNLEQDNVEMLCKKYSVDQKSDTKKVAKELAEKVKERWSGVAYENFKKIKKSQLNDIEDLKELVEELFRIMNENREYFVEKEVQTFLRNIVGNKSFLNKSFSKDKSNKKKFKDDFELPIVRDEIKKEKKYNCIYCNSRSAKANTIFSTGLAFHQGLNKDNINFAWGFTPNLPLCEICELVYFCHWAGYSKSLKDDTYLFINDDSSIKNLWDSNQLLQQVLNSDKEENLLINYFYQLLVQEEKVKSKYTLQNIAIIESSLQSDVMPKVFSLHVSRNQARFIKNNQERLKWLSSKFYNIQNEYTNVLHEYLQLLLEKKLNHRMVNRLIRYFIQSRDTTKSFVNVNYTPSNIQQLVALTADYFETINQKSIEMEKKHIWFIYSKGNDMKQLLMQREAENKIQGIAYRLLNAVRAGDKSTFLNILLRLYIGYGIEVPKSLVNTLETEEKFQIIGHSYINGLLGESLDN